MRQLGNCQLHCSTDRDANDAFVLVDPGIAVQRLLRVFARGFQIFDALFRARLFVIGSSRQGSNHCQYNDPEQCEEKHDAEPRGQRSARMCNLANRFNVGHVS